jgi:hypothetical protein
MSLLENVHSASWHACVDLEGRRAPGLLLNRHRHRPHQRPDGGSEPPDGGGGGSDDGEDELIDRI